MSQTPPLHKRHVDSGAKFAEFGGWQMPLEFAGGGVLAEHAAVRERAGLFDVSHMGTLRITGPGAKDALNRVLVNDLNRIGLGQAQYTMLCTPDGGVVDDMIVYQLAEDDLLIVPNAANTAAVRNLLAHALGLGSGARVADVSADTAIIALQGPRSPEILVALGLHTDLPYMSALQLDDDNGLVARTGYTGEVGYEFVIPAVLAESWWDRLLAEVERAQGLCCGLGARDTLRTEMGYPLHGNELSEQITPVQAGLGWAIGWNKPEFIGKRALDAERRLCPAVRLRGLVAQQRAIPRAGMAVRHSALDPAADPGIPGPVVGHVTSGTFSPTLGTGIALALLDHTVEVGDDVHVETRGRPVHYKVTRPPFVHRSPG